MSENLNKLSIWDEEHSGKRRVCMLMVTHACNLNCSYCYETHKDSRNISLDLAKSVIRQEAELVANSDKFDELQVDFMGGEPMMNFKLIKEIVEWLKCGGIDVPWICFASTNATLITPEIKEWLRENKRYIVLGASYDGTGKMQECNRGTNHFEIDLNFFHELWPEQTFQMTISKETLSNLAEGVLFVQRKGYEVNASLAQGVDWNIEDAHLYLKQLRQLKEEYLKDLSIKPLNRLTRYVDVFNLSASERQQIHGCGSGLNMVTYDVDGSRYGCHMFTPIVLGNRAIGVSDVEWDKPGLMADPYCSTCVLRRFCPTCPGFNYKYRGDFATRDDGHFIDYTGIFCDNVSFSYFDSKHNVGTPIISKFTYDFKPGTLNAIVGETGKGKTTLFKLFLAILQPSNGRIIFYKNDSKCVASVVTRKSCVYVPQGNSIISGTIRYNLKLGNLDATDTEMVQALHLASADFVMNEFSEGLDTIVGEKGIGLSEGQAQRISIARGLLQKKPILLLDEPTSALDSETEKEFLSRLKSSSLGLTIIMITHKTKIYDYFDNIVSLNNTNNK